MMSGKLIDHGIGKTRIGFSGQQCAYVGMGFAVVCPVCMAGNAIHAADIVLKFRLFFPLVMEQPQDISPFAHAELTGKPLCQMCHAQAMSFIALIGKCPVRKLLDMGNVWRYGGCLHSVI